MEPVTMVSMYLVFGHMRAIMMALPSPMEPEPSTRMNLARSGSGRRTPATASRTDGSATQAVSTPASMSVVSYSQFC
jgi:hypothetical protein